MGSTTTSSVVPDGQPSSATCSISVRLCLVGQHLRLAMVVPSPSKMRTVWALAMPRSMPTRRRWFIVSLLGVVAVTHRLARQATPLVATVPG